MPLRSEAGASASSSLRGLPPIDEREKYTLKHTLAGKPRRRPSMPFGASSRSYIITSTAGDSSADSSTRPPEAWRDPSQDILSGKGSTLQHARSVYAAGPIEVLPGLFLGDEHNARDQTMLSRMNIKTILNVAKETTLPFQDDKAALPLRKPHNIAALRPKRAMSYSVHDETFYTPATSTFPSDAVGAIPSPLDPSSDGAHFPPPDASDLPASIPHISSRLCRNTLSTPNLQAQFQSDAASADVRRNESDVGSDNTRNTPDRAISNSDSSEESKRSHSSHDSSTVPPSSQGTELSEEPDEIYRETLSGSEDPGALYSAVALSADVVSLTVPPSPQSGRNHPIRYVKLPWTHDQTGLAGLDGGFSQGCAVIAEALAIDHYGQPLMDEAGNLAEPGNVLVHCQCGVSRSATLAIAFVMQAAAFNFPYEATRRLTGMHDCYNMVKDLSASISPNISLIYQLVEWERHLSAEAVQLRQVLQEQSRQGLLADQDFAAKAPAMVGWSSEVMGEEEWTRMRLEEEKKEQAEEEARRQHIAEIAKLQVEEKQRLQRGIQDVTAAPVNEEESADVVSSMKSLASAQGGLGARRRKRTPSLKLGGPSAESNTGNVSPQAQPLNQPPSLARRFESSGADSASNHSQRLEFGNLARDSAPPLPSAGLRESFFTPATSTFFAGGEDSSDTITRKLPTLRLGNDQPIIEGDELLTSTEEEHLGLHQRYQASESTSSDRAMRVSPSPPLATLPVQPLTSPGHVFAPSIASDGMLTNALASGGKGTRPRSFQSLTTSNSFGRRLGSTQQGSNSYDFSFSSASSPPQSTLVSLLQDPPKANFGNFAMNPKARGQRKQQHRRTFSSEPVNFDAIKAALTTAALNHSQSPSASQGTTGKVDDNQSAVA